MGLLLLREALIKSFDRLRTNGKLLIPFVVSLSNHERNRFVQRFLSKVSVKSIKLDCHIHAQQRSSRIYLKNTNALAHRSSAITLSDIDAQIFFFTRHPAILKMPVCR
ncbi:hypothetical protein B0F88_11517 [Methylobacter tundripaludum]|uniref:Uncharacterized protein n=1 Tax=Methylobacter tundripaludum TaxID=173365 RepID=A0A2S6GNW6_9GAMM|nr:hypothetical protein B0F88_11517 [Methylobacter tundripaludum]